MLAAAEPFSQVSEPLQPGIHLHWALPDALTHGAAAGAGATAVATVDASGAVTGVAVTGGGSGYAHPPLVVFSGSGSGATATAAVDASGVVTSITVDSGGANYHSAPAVSVQPALGFPSAPNRWLVVRMISDSVGARSSHTAWVVESDRLWDAEPGSPAAGANAASIAAPIRPDPMSADNRAFRQQGWVTPLAEWVERGDASSSTAHTAIGYGSPTYAASYRDCPNVFGFWDVLDDLATPGSAWDAAHPADARLAYVVVGWHSTPAADPLTPLGDADWTTFGETLASLKWSIAAPPDGAAVPTAALYHGTVSGLTWDPGRVYVAPRPQTPVQVAVGNNLPEALAALLAAELPDQPNVDQILTALQMGLLSRLDVTGALPAGRLADFEEALHAGQFRPSPGGTIWLVTRGDAAGSAGGPPSAELADAAAQLGATLPAALAAQLNRLNSTQQAADEQAGEIVARRAQIFADWYKYMCLEWDSATTGAGRTAAPDEADQVTPAAAKAYITTEVAALDAELARLELLRGATAPTGDDPGGVQYQLGRLANDLATTWAAEGLRIDVVGAPRYWQPNDPVVILAGDDLLPPLRHGQDGRDQADLTLRCRRAGEVIATMHVAAGAVVEVTAVQVLAAAGAPQLDGAMQALLAEAVFIDPDQTWLLAAAAAAAGAHGVGAAIAAAQAILVSASGPQGSGAVTFSGSAPSPIGINRWTANPWLPITMEWHAEYVDPLLAAAGYRPDHLAGNFAWDDDDIDLVAEAAVPVTMPAGDTYRGTVALSGNTDVNLRGQISRYLANNPTSEYTAQLTVLRDMPMLATMAQALSGFADALLMRRQTLQLPVGDPLAIKRDRARAVFSNVAVCHAVEDQNRSAPLPGNAYHPIRAGLLRLSGVRIVDAFGQVRDVDVGTVLASPTLQAPGGSTTMVLPPRLTQPARLLMRLLSADDDQVEMNVHPATTPICGWVLFNHLDDALMIYDASGTPLASLNGHGAFCRGAPGDQATFGATAATIFAAANPHLRAFVQSITGPAALAELLGVIDRATTVIDPAASKQNVGLSVLIGRPLAIVRASLDLDLAGLPALDQSWRAFAAAIAGACGSTTSTQCGPYDPASRDVAAFTDVDIAVQLGDLSNVDDGVVGYFVDDAGGPATFYAASAPVSGTSFVRRPTRDTLRVRRGTRVSAAARDDARRPARAHPRVHRDPARQVDRHPPGHVRGGAAAPGRDVPHRTAPRPGLGRGAAAARRARLRLDVVERRTLGMGGDDAGPAEPARPVPRPAPAAARGMVAARTDHTRPAGPGGRIPPCLSSPSPTPPRHPHLRSPSATRATSRSSTPAPGPRTTTSCWR